MSLYNSCGIFFLTRFLMSHGHCMSQFTNQSSLSYRHSGDQLIASPFSFEYAPDFKVVAYVYINSTIRLRVSYTLGTRNLAVFTREKPWERWACPNLSEHVWGVSMAETRRILQGLIFMFRLSVILNAWLLSLSLVFTVSHSRRVAGIIIHSECQILDAISM